MSTSPFVPLDTFMGLPFRSDAKGSKAAILGIPFDCGTHPTRIGSRLGPASIREQSRLLRPHDPLSGLDPLESLKVVDCGDAAVKPGEIEPSYAAIAASVGSILKAGATPITMGGDGAIVLPEMRALHGTYPDLVAVHLDAHTDAYPIPGYNTATGFARAAEEGVVDAGRSFHIGVRGSTMVPGIYEHALKLGYSLVTMSELARRGIAAVMGAVRRKVGDRPVYLCFDMDFFDPSVAPGVCTPVWGGVSAAEGLLALELCCALDIVALDVNTVSPPHDTGGMSAFLAATVMLSALTHLARKGAPTRRQMRAPRAKRR
ncbi:MAG: arginase family protein [Proteobacteria bacterium]|nr:arginase family protein [Pseudomonadota bacterium]MBI3498972.1 arginase family protein [Pseudomonadota bacterium]